MTRKELKEARNILKPVLRAEKKLLKATKALVVAKLALAHALVDANVESNPTLAAWTDGVLNGDDASLKKVYRSLSTKKAGKKSALADSTPEERTPVQPAPKRKTTSSAAKSKSVLTAIKKS